MKTVLLIEDDAVVRENTAELLELANYKVLTAANGKVGVHLAKTKLPDVIICDIMMPELNGYGVLQILSKEKITQQIPFIFLSAKTDHKDVRKGMNMGADDYITKPFDESELFSAIESRLAKVAIVNENQLIENKHTQNLTNESELKTLEHLKNYFLNNAEEHLFYAGEVIYHQGDNSNFIYLINSGIVKTYKIDEQGKELITELLKEGDFFGFTSFSNNTSHQEFAAAIENTNTLKISNNNLKTILHNNHDLTLELFDYLSDNVYEIKEHLLEMAYSSVRKKTASTILQFSEKIKANPNICVQILRSDLASIAGIATETFIRTLSDFKKEGLIDVDGRNIKILNIEKLKRIN
ncbi:response regulator [Lutibacter maritimus]|uniref:cAMP-binding domain of CRP or a regulatory subunit of cAMP-dependent protein kinases n=1 Tax=Lutibacter maritimus TaxID=593133 RepID=A0A1I6R4K5_9FLAO|nr:response regulator [Lutibacter maritimus]SFS59677.1 cAMP-binding domain of CRP or a regulatory subunit of cAMP-dependent protein kinases [Lutibacter maritimus]